MNGADEFRDRVALVTGAASGIGAATARLFSAHGAIVYCADIEDVGCRRTAIELHGQAAGDFAVTLDVTNEDEWAAGIQHIVAASGRLDILVNSAGISHGASIAEMTLAEWRRVFAVNLDSIFLGTKHAIRAMTPTGGVIVNVSSASGIRLSAGATAYSTSKAAVGTFTRAAAKECRERNLGIRINAVAPAGVRTPLWSTMPFFQALVAEHGSEDAAFQALSDPASKRGFADPEEIAAAILYLASDAARMITGVELPVDDGYTL